MSSWYNEAMVRQPGSVILNTWLAQRKASATGPAVARFALGRPVFPGRNYANFAKEAYQLNIIAYRCIELVATAAASIPLLVYRDDKEVDQHSLLTLLKRPNPTQSGNEMFTVAYAFDLLAGNTYYERVMVTGNRIQEMHVLRPDRMKVVPGRFGLPQRMEYTVGGQEPVKFDVDPITGMSDVLHVKRFNPLDDWYGQSPLEAMGMSVDSHNEATRWNYALLRNGARPSGALEYPTGNLDDKEFERLKSEITENYGGGYADQRPGTLGKQGRPMLLQGGLKWVQMMLNQMEMDWAAGKEVSAREIALGFKVPEQLVGVQGHQTYNNYREARMALYEDAVLPLVQRHVEAITNWMQTVPEFEGLRLAYDEDRIPALALRREAIWDKVLNAKHLTIDEKREALGYEPYEPGEKPGELIYMTASELPLTDAFNDFASGGGADTSLTPQLDEEGNPLPAATAGESDDDKPLAPAATGDGLPPTTGPVQDLALNGAQIQAAVEIVQAVADGTLPAESAIHLLLVAFPSIDENTARAMVAAAEAFEPEKPTPPVMMPGVPPQPPALPGQPPKPAKPPKKADTPAEKAVMHAVIAFTTKRRAALRNELLRKAHELAYGKGA